MSNSIKMESLIQPRPGRGNPSVPNPSMIEEPIDAIYLQPQNNPSHIEVAGDDRDENNNILNVKSNP